MVQNYKRKNKEPPSKEKAIQDTLRQVREGKLSIRKAAKEVRVYKKTLRNRIKKRNKKMGGQAIIPEEYERELAVNLELRS